MKPRLKTESRALQAIVLTIILVSAVGGAAFLYFDGGTKNSPVTSGVLTENSTSTSEEPAEKPGVVLREYVGPNVTVEVMDCTDTHCSASISVSDWDVYTAVTVEDVRTGRVGSLTKWSNQANVTVRRTLNNSDTPNSLRISLPVDRFYGSMTVSMQEEHSSTAELTISRYMLGKNEDCIVFNHSNQTCGPLGSTPDL